MDNFKIKDPPEYNDVLRMLETSDRARADIFNILFEQLVNNDAFLRKFLEKLEETAKKHIEDDDLHVTAQNKEDWNAKAETTEATQSQSGLMSAGDKKKLDNVAENAEVNQNAYSNIKVGKITISANGKTSTLTLEAGANITISADNASKKITITADKNGGNADMVDGYHAAHFANADHAHDGRYNTKGEITTLLNQKAASSHTHDNRYYTEAEVNNLLANKAASMVVSEGDYNNMKTPGLYTMRTITTNSPDGGGYFGLLVLKSDNGDYVEQIAVKESSGNVYVRYLSGSSWSAWKLLANGSIYGDTIISCGRKSATTIGSNSIAHGFDAEASNNYAVSFGYKNTASGDCAYAQGYGNISSSYQSHTHGYKNTASGSCSSAEGSENTASGGCSHVGGQKSSAVSTDSFAYGTHCYAGGWGQAVFGRHNKKTPDSEKEKVGDMLIVGNGYDISNLSNAFRVHYNGMAYVKTAYNTGGADYAELFEWLDNNVNGEDRVGYFVALEDNKVRIASSQDYILGIVSGAPSVIGNSPEDWAGRWKKDVFGRPIKELSKIPVMAHETYEEPILDEDGNETGEYEHRIHEVETGEFTELEHPIVVEDYDSSKPYICRIDRPEWAAIGMLGVLAVYDDGTCQVNGYCRVADGGIATATEGEYMLVDGKLMKGYRVIERVADDIVKVIFR